MYVVLGLGYQSGIPVSVGINCRQIIAGTRFDTYPYIDIYLQVKILGIWLNNNDKSINSDLCSSGPSSRQV